MDIDLDIQPGFDLKRVLPTAVSASQVDKARGILVKHVGVYLQDVPVDPISGLAAAPFKLASELGCFKVDLLPLHVLSRFNNRADMLALLDEEPDWNLLLIPSVVKQLFHMHDHADILEKLRPKSLLELADSLALIRPQKAYMLPYYLKDREGARKLLYAREKGEAYAFKKAHAIAYAMIIVLQLHLSKANLL